MLSNNGEGRQKRPLEDFDFGKEYPAQQLLQTTCNRSGRCVVGNQVVFTFPQHYETVEEDFNGFVDFQSPPLQWGPNDNFRGETFSDGQYREGCVPYPCPGTTVEEAMQQDVSANESVNEQYMTENALSSAPRLPRWRLGFVSTQEHYPPNAPHAQSRYHHNSMGETPLWYYENEACRPQETSTNSWGVVGQGMQGHPNYTPSEPQLLQHPIPLQHSSAMGYSCQYGPPHGPPMYFSHGEASRRTSYPSFPPPGGYSAVESTAASSTCSSFDPRRSRAKTFPEKFMKAVLLEHPKEDAIAWLPDGRSFVIVDPDRFVTQVLDKAAFKKSKYASFIRKLHRWGFSRLTSGTGTDCFYHPSFTIHDPQQASNIRCVPPQERQQLLQPEKDRYKPSLDGVERFIRAKLIAARAEVTTAGAEYRPTRCAQRVVSQQSNDGGNTMKQDPVVVQQCSSHTTPLDEIKREVSPQHEIEPDLLSHGSSPSCSN